MSNIEVPLTLMPLLTSLLDADICTLYTLSRYSFHAVIHTLFCTQQNSGYPWELRSQVYMKFVCGVSKLVIS